MSMTFLTPDKIREMALGFQRSRILLSAYELGIFSALGDKGKTAQEVSGLLGTDARATDRLMNALCAMGLLNKQGDKFLNSPEAARFLNKGSSDYLCGLRHMVNMWDTWSTLTQAVKRGRSVLNSKNGRGIFAHALARAKALFSGKSTQFGDEWLSAFIAAMHERALSQADKIISLIELSGVSQVLDVGGGSGVYAMGFVRAAGWIKAAVFDLPAVIPLTRKYVAQAGLLDKIKFISGDYNADDLGSGFDLVFISAVVHSNSAQENRALIHKCANALKPNGQVVVQDFIMDEDRTRPEFGAFFALNMLVATEAGDTYAESEVRGWMHEAGLSDPLRKDTGLGTALIIGRKK